MSPLLDVKPHSAATVAPALTREALCEALCDGKVLVVGLGVKDEAAVLVESLGLPLSVHVDAKRTPDAWEVY